MNKKKVTIILIGVLLVIVSVFFINNSNNGIFKNIEMTNSVDEGDDNLTDFQKENKEKEKEIHQKAVSEKIEQLDNDKGLYSTDSIVLSDTTKEDAEHIAEEIGAEVRMTKKGDFAVLYLPKDVSIEDIYDNDKYASYIPQMTPDYYVSTNLINGNGMDEEDAVHNANMIVRNHPNYSINDPAYTNQQYIDYINLKDTWEGTRGAGITVAVIDSGIDTDHTEFIGKISEKSYNASEDKIVKDYDISVIEDENGHGTAVAGVLAASMNNSEGITGISPDVNLVVIKCDVDDTGKFVRGSDLVFGLAYAIESDVDIINMSFGSPIDIFSRYTKLAVDSDIICIAAAGNDGSNMPVYPASLDSVIAVGAYDTENGGLTEYSNYGDNVDLLAPGTAYTTYIDGGYKMSTGTSISAPIVSGAAALYIASNGKTQFDEMRQLFEASSHDLGDPGQDYRHGFGELDVYALVCEEKGTITYDMLTDELENEKQIFVKGHTVQVMPEPEREYSVCDGWFFDPNCSDECEMYTYIFNEDTTLYAEWINEDEGVPFTYAEQEDGTIVILSYTGKRRFVTIPVEIEGKKVTRIADAAFAGNRRIRNMTLPDGIVEIGERAFANCDALRFIDLPDKTKRIRKEAFEGCVRLGKINITENSELTEIGECAFRNTGLAGFYIPKNLNTLGNMVFYGCTSFNNIEVASGNSSYRLKNDALYDISGAKLIYYPSALSGEYAIEESTKYIDNGAFAFSRCTEININDGIVAIGDSSFEYSSIKKIDIPKSVETIGSGFCNGCSYLKEVYFAENGKLNIINSNAFSRTGSLTKVEIPDYVESISSMAFMFSSISEVTISDSSQLKEIGRSAFAYTNIDKIKIPDAVEVIGEDTFSYDSMLTEVTFTDNSNCNKISENAFLNDISLKEFSIPDKVTELGQRAFYNSGLEKIHIGKSLTNLGTGVFSSCGNLSDISVSEGNPVYASYDGVLYNHDKTVLMIFPAAKEGTYTMPQEVITIAPYAFSGADKLNEIIMNEGLVTIGENAFEYCQSMETPILPSTLEEIDGYAFTFCSAMRETLLIPKNVKSISWFAFAYDYELSNIDFEPECKLDRISYGAFAYCGIEDFTIPTNVSTMAQEVFRGCDRLLTVTFEADSKIEHLPAWAFNGADNLRRITFEDGCNMKTIEARACEGLKQLENIDFSGCTMLTCIDNYAFKSCVALENINIPKTINEIGRYAFYGCGKMNEMRIPDTISRIGRYAFTRTDSINLYFEGAVLPDDLEDKWDYGIGAYYVGIDSLHENDEWIYAVTNDAKASVIKYKGNSSTVELDTIDGYEVVSIGSEAFKNNTTLSGISLPDTLTGIYRQAFYGTTSLDNINIPSEVKVIESEAFKNSGIKTVVFEEDSRLTSLGSSVFENTGGLTEIELPIGITMIRDNTFYQSGITSVSLPDGISEIGRLAFAETKLESILIPSSVKDISYKAFKDTTKLSDVSFASGIENVMIRDEAFYHSGITEIALPKGIAYIGSLCFARCGSLTAINVAEDNLNYASDNGVLYDKALTKLINCPAGKTGDYTVPESVMTFSFGAFEGCKLSEVIIPNECKLITLGHRVFYDCDNLVSITIPDSVQSIDYYAFAYCDNLENVTINPQSQINGIYTGAFYNCSKLNGIVIPDSVLEISDYAFYGCSSLSDVDISENSRLQGVYAHAFEYTAIENFVMPQEMLELGAYSFHATKLKTFVFNDVLTDIGDYALAESGLTETTVVEVPVTVEHIGKYFMEGIESIEELTLPFLGESVDSDGNALLLYTFGGTKLGPSHQLDKLKKVSVLGGRVIAEHGFGLLFNIREIYIPSTIVQIGCNAFYECKNLKVIVLPDGIKVLEQGAFNGCSALETINIPEQCEIICNNVFDNTGLKIVHIPENVRVIDRGAFSCEYLKEITVDDNNTYFKSISGILYNYDLTKILVVPKNIEGEITIPDGIQEIGAYAFVSCKGITKVIMPESVTIVGEHAFNMCTGLNDIVWSERLEKIGAKAFAYCTNLHEVEIPDSVENIDLCAFEGCWTLKKMIFSDNINVLRGYTCYGDEELESVYIGKKTKCIEGNCFSKCSNLKEVMLPEELEIIEKEAFVECSSIEGIYLPRNVKTIGDGAFSKCSNLSFIEVDENNKYYVSYDGILYDYDVTKVIFVPDKVSGNIIIPDGIKEIYSGVFYNHDKITGINLPDSVEKIGDNAFADCILLKNLNMGDKIKEIGAGIFDNTAYALDDNNYSDDVLYVGNYVVGVKSIWLNDTISIKEGTLLIAKETFNNAKMSKIYLPDSLCYINTYAFRTCDNLKCVRWGKNIVSIQDWGTFQGCNKIKSLYLYNKEVEVTDGAFTDCAFRYVKVDSDEFKNMYYIGNQVVTYNGVYHYKGYYEGDFIPENLVLNNKKQEENTYIETPVSGINIYTRLDKETSILDSEYLAGNNIYYGGEWNLSTFYVDGMIVTMLPIRSNQVVQEPAGTLVSEYLPDGATFMGWDINGDGLVDDLPATLSSDLEAVAVYDAPITSITVDESVFVEVDEQKQLSVDLNPIMYNSDDTLSWVSDDVDIASVDDTGMVTGNSIGNTKIRVSLKENENIYADCYVSVVPKNYGIKLNESSTVINVGENYNIEPVVTVPDGDLDVTEYASDNTDIVTVDDNGVVTAIAPGIAEITITHGAYNCTLDVTVKQPMTNMYLDSTEGVLNVNETLTLEPIFEPVNTTDNKNAFWYSKDPSIARVNSLGTVTAIAPGTTDIIGTVGEYKVSFTLTVKAPIERITLNTSKGTLRLDKTKQLDVIYIPSNTTDDKAVVWESDNPDIASVDENGLVTGVENGKATITATVGDHTASYVVSVIGLRDETTGITITNSDDTEMEEGTTIEVEELDDTQANELCNGYRGMVLTLVRDKSGRIYIMYIYDISLFRESQSVQPDRYVDVDIPVPHGKPHEGMGIYRMEPNGDFTDMHAGYEDGYYRFKTNHFSVYCVAVPTDEYEAAEIETNTNSIELCVGKTFDIEAEVLPQEAVDKTIHFSSVDDDIVKVDENGRVTAVKEGKTTITVKSAVEDVYTLIDVGVTGHKWDAGEETVKATCTENGEMTYTCERCGETRTEEIEAKGHTEVKDEAVTPTSTKKGLTEGSHCSVCGEVLVAQKEIPMLSGVPFTIDVSRISDEEYVNSLAVNVDGVVIPTVEINSNDDKIIINLLDEEHEYTVIGDNQNVIIKTDNVNKIIADNVSIDSIHIALDTKDNDIAEIFELAVSGNNNIKNILSDNETDIIIKSDENNNDMNDEVISKLTMAPQEGVSISTNGKLEISGVDINITSVDTAIYADDIVIDSSDMKIELTGDKDVKSIIAAENSITIKSGNVNTVKPEGSKAFDFEVLSPSGKITLLTGATVSDKVSYSVEPIIESNAGQNDNGNDKNKTADDKEKVEDKYPVDGKQVQDESGENDSSDSVPSNSDTTKDQNESNIISIGDTITYKSVKYKVLAGGKVEYVSSNNKKIKSVVIPATIIDDNGNKYNVTEIANNAFKNYKKLTKVTIGKNVTKIGKNAFNGCKKLSKITIKSSSLKTVGKNAIKGINKKATIKVTKKKLTKYKKLFKKSTGYKKTMKIK